MIFNLSDHFFSKKKRFVTLVGLLAKKTRGPKKTLQPARYDFSQRLLDYFVLFQRISSFIPLKCLIGATWPSMKVTFAKPL